MTTICRRSSELFAFVLFEHIQFVFNLYSEVPTGSPSHGGDVVVFCQRHKPTQLAHSFFYSVYVSVSVFMALSTLFHSINSPDSSPFSHSVLPVLSLPYWPFQLYITL